MYMALQNTQSTSIRSSGFYRLWNLAGTQMDYLVELISWCFFPTPPHLSPVITH